MVELLVQYCPFDIIRDLGVLGLASSHVDTQFGRTHIVTRRREGPLTVLIHGIGGTWSSWTPLLQAAQCTEVDLGSVLLIDLPGFGSSENRLKALDSATVGEMVLAIAAKQGHDRVRLVGQSMGAYLASDMAARWPDRVTHVTALAGSFQNILSVGRHPIHFALQHPKGTLTNVSIFALNRMGRPGRRGARLIRAAGAQTIFDQIVAHPDRLRPSVVSALGAGFTAKNLLYAWRNSRRGGNLADWTSITASTSFVWGELDPLVPPSEQEYVARLLPSASGAIIADAAHIAHIERPFEVLEVLAR